MPTVLLKTEIDSTFMRVIEPNPHTFTLKKEMGMEKFG